MLKLEQLELCSKEIKEMRDLQRIFKDINDHYERVVIGDIDNNDCMVELTIDNNSFVSHSSYVSHELICTTLFKIFENHLKSVEEKGIIIDTELNDLCENPYFNRYGLVRTIEDDDVNENVEIHRITEVSGPMKGKEND